MNLSSLIYQMNKEHDWGSCVNCVGADGVCQLVEYRSQAQSERHENETVLQVVASQTLVQVEYHFEHLKMQVIVEQSSTSGRQAGSTKRYFWRLCINLVSLGDQIDLEIVIHFNQISIVF